MELQHSDSNAAKKTLQSYSEAYMEDKRNQPSLRFMRGNERRLFVKTNFDNKVDAMMEKVFPKDEEVVEPRVKVKRS